MKNSVLQIVENFPLDALINQNFLIYILAGLLITALVQSSSAVVALTLSLIHSEMIQFYDACYIIIGSNIGTTFTVLVGTLGAQSTMKKVALSHFFFNFFTAIIATISLPLIIYCIELFFTSSDDPVLGIAIFHTIFNLIGVLLFIPLIAPFSKFIDHIVKEKKVTTTYYIQKALPSFPEESTSAFKNEVIYLIHLSMAHNAVLLNVNRQKLFEKFNDKPYYETLIKYSSIDLYATIKKNQTELFKFGAQMQQNELTESTAFEINRILHATRYTVASSKSFKDIKKEVDELSSSDQDEIEKIYHSLKSELTNFYSSMIHVLHHPDSSENVSTILKWNDKIRLNDAALVNNLIGSISKTNINEDYINTLISSQRGFALSNRQMLLSIKDICLNDSENKIFDNFDNYEI